MANNKAIVLYTDPKGNTRQVNGSQGNASSAIVLRYGDNSRNVVTSNTHPNAAARQSNARTLNARTRVETLPLTYVQTRVQGGMYYDLYRDTQNNRPVFITTRVDEPIACLPGSHGWRNSICNPADRMNTYRSARLARSPPYNIWVDVQMGNIVRIWTTDPAALSNIQNEDAGLSLGNRLGPNNNPNNVSLRGLIEYEPRNGLSNSNRNMTPGLEEVYGGGKKKSSKTTKATPKNLTLKSTKSTTKDSPLKTKSKENAKKVK